ncbi:site-specific integrase [Vibrio sp. WXL210]|uniref:site-specific integrase n=1 Tax=Vibrio sp. WXL210 TaxID=3450709 RepID=UPI003EC6E38C
MTVTTTEAKTLVGEVPMPQYRDLVRKVTKVLANARNILVKRIKSAQNAACSSSVALLALRESSTAKKPHLSIDDFRALALVRDIYPFSMPPEEAALVKAHEIKCEFQGMGDEMFESVRVEFEWQYQLMKEARCALESLKFEKVTCLIEEISEKSMQMKLCDQDDYSCGHDKDNTKSRRSKELEEKITFTFQGEQISVGSARDKVAIALGFTDCFSSYGPTSFEYLAVEYVIRKTITDEVCRKNTDGLAKEAVNTVKKCAVVFELIETCDVNDLEDDDGVYALQMLREFPIVSRSKINQERFLTKPKWMWSEINREVGLERISKSTVGRYIEKASTFMKWAIAHNKLVTGSNPFVGVASKKNGYEDDPERNVDPFSEQDLKWIFSLPIYSEFNIKLHRTKNMRKYSQYWAPLMAVLSGGRPNELAQLKRKNIKCEHGIHYFHFSGADTDQRLKNKRANRHVPIHSFLIKLGFLKYISVFDSDELIFPELHYSDKNGYFGDIGEWFMDLINNLPGFEKKRFYSFRHSFTDVFKQAGEAVQGPASLLGHANGNITYDTYGKKIALEKLQELVEMVDFSDVLKDVKPFEWLD